MKKTFELWDKETKKVVKVEAKKVGKEWKAICPKHEDNKPSLSINEEQSVYHCFGCQWSGHLYDPDHKRKENNARKLKIESQIIPIPKSQIESYAKALSDEGIQFLKEIRGITSEVIHKYKMGWCKEKQRFTIPIPWQGRYVNVRLYHPDKNPKILPISPGRSIQLFPENQLKNNEIWLCEGELDTLCAISHGLSAITVTGGAGSWKEEFTPLFKDKKVNIVYDCDEAGRKGAEKIAEILSKVAEVKIVDLGLGEGEDLTNWLVDYGKTKEELEKLASKTPVFEKLTEAQKKIKKLAKQIKVQSITASDLLKKEFPSGRFWVEKGLLPKEGYILLAGPTKEGKTTLSLQLSLHLITKTTFLNQFPIAEEARILYLFAENTLPGLQKILQKQVNGAHQFGWQISTKNLENLILQPGHHINFDYKKGLQLIDELIKEHGPDIVILDPISLFVSKDLNKLENVTRLVNSLLDIGSKRNCTWIIISHYRKPSEQKTEPIYQVIGSSGFGNYCESFLGLERYHERRSAHYKILHFLLRQEETPDPIVLHRNPETLLFETVREQEAIQAGAKPEDIAKILKEKLGGKSSYTILVSLASKELGVKKGRITELLNEAREQGLIDKEKGRYGKWYVL